MIMKLLQPLELGVVALGASLGRRHTDYLVDAGGLGPLPGWMAQRRAALFALGRRTARRGRGSFAPFELAAVQGVELRLKLLIFEFQFLELASLLIEQTLELLQLVFIVVYQES
jgi:hypothetical protein